MPTGPSASLFPRALWTPPLPDGSMLLGIAVTAFATWHAAGVAAAMRADDGAFPDVAAVRAELVRQGTYLTRP